MLKRLLGALKQVQSWFIRLKMVLGRSFNYCYPINRYGFKLLVPVIHGTGRAHRDVHEPHIALVMERLHRSGASGLLIDIGANIGQTLLKHAAITRGNSRYIGIEPNPAAVYYLQELIELNRLVGYAIIPAALSTTDGIVKIHLSQANRPDPGASINESFRDEEFYGSSAFVTSISSRLLFSELPIDERNFLIKIDAEGSELSILEELSELLKTRRPYVLVEILGASKGFSTGVNRYRSERRVAIFELMDRLNFVPFCISERGAFLKVKSFDSAPTGYTNDFAFVPKELCE